MLKEAPGLKYKTLYPTNLERQKVSLVLGIFNDKTVEALASKADETSKETATFINVILSWWKIMNVKSVYKGARLRDELSKPFTSCDDAVESLHCGAVCIDSFMRIISDIVTAVLLLVTAMGTAILYAALFEFHHCIVLHCMLLCGYMVHN